MTRALLLHEPPSPLASSGQVSTPARTRAGIRAQVSRVFDESSAGSRIGSARRGLAGAGRRVGKVFSSSAAAPPGVIAALLVREWGTDVAPTSDVVLALLVRAALVPET